MDQLHKEMDEAMDKRKHKIKHAVKLKDFSMQWGLIAVGVEEGVIDFFKLEGKEATKIKGRSKITFSKTKRARGCLTTYMRMTRMTTWSPELAGLGQQRDITQDSQTR